MFSIQKSSTELNDALEPRWHFPSALSPEAHAEWGLYKILEYMELHEIPQPCPEAHAEWGLYKILEYMELHERAKIGPN